VSKIVEIFEPYESALTRFAISNGLEIEKYRHGVAIWQFRKLHPRDGRARIAVLMNGKGGIHVQLYWDREGFFKRSKNGEDCYVNLNSDELSEILETKLNEIVSWK
jgi:hypothetical protein